MIAVASTPRGILFDVLETGPDGDRAYHRETCVNKRQAQRVAAGLRDGSRVYDPELGHTVTVPKTPCAELDPLAAMLAELEQ